MRLIFVSFHRAATPEIYTLSYTTLFRSLGINSKAVINGDETQVDLPPQKRSGLLEAHRFLKQDRKSTRLNSSHPSTSYAVFCLKKKTTPTARSTTLPRSTNAQKSVNMIP